MSTSAVLVLASVPPIDLLAEERKETFQLRKVIRHPGDEDERARWACRALQQRGPIEIVSGPASVVLRLGLDYPRRPGEESLSFACSTVKAGCSTCSLSFFA